MLPSFAGFTLSLGALLLGGPGAGDPKKIEPLPFVATGKFSFDPKKPNKKDEVRGTPYEEYKVPFTPGRFYEIEMRADSPTFFPCLRLEKDGRQIKSASSRDKADDGSADEYTACMIYFCTENGEFKIIATNYSGALGTFELKVREHTPRIYDMTKGEDFFIQIPSELARTDPKDSVLKKSPCKSFWFKFKKDYAYQIDLLAEPFDAVLRLEDDAGQELEFNDDRPGGSRDSQITFLCKRDLTYRVVATSLNLYYQNTAGNPDLGCGRFSLIVTQMPTKGQIGQFIKEVMNTSYELKIPAKGKLLYETSGYPLDVVFDAKTVSFAYQLPGTPPGKEKKGAWNEMHRLKIKESNGDVFPVGKNFLIDAIPYTGDISFDKLKALHDRVMWDQLEFNKDEVKDLTDRDVDIFIRYVMKTTYKIGPPNEKVLCHTQKGFDVIYDRKAKTVSYVFPYAAPPGEAKREAWNKKGKNSRVEVSKGNLYKESTVYFAGNPMSFADGISFAKLKELHDQLWREKQKFDKSLDQTSGQSPPAGERANEMATALVDLLLAPHERQMVRNDANRRWKRGDR